MVLIPEGLIEFIPAVKALIAELNDLLAAKAEEFAAIEPEAQRQWVIAQLSEENAKTYESLPAGVARQLTLDRDPHGNVQVSLIETEKLLSESVLKPLLPKVNIAVNMLLCTTSSDTKVVAQIPLTSMPTIATVLGTPLPISSHRV